MRTVRTTRVVRTLNFGPRTEVHLADGTHFGIPTEQAPSPLQDVSVEFAWGKHLRPVSTLLVAPPTMAELTQMRRDLDALDRKARSVDPEDAA